MTVTKRKTNNQKSEVKAASDASGVKYNCDGCSADISHTVRIRCAHQHTVTTNTGGQAQTHQALVCENFDLCGQCFCEGKEVGRHKAWHDYRVVEPRSIPIFTEDWGADEELLLIEACQMYGLGNWSDIADHVGNGRTKEEVERHYLDVFIASDDYPLPPTDVRIDMDQEEFQARKKRRLEEVRSRPIQLPIPQSLQSAPTNHEIGGFMPGRLDFETEWENEAENSIKDLSFGRVYRFGGDSQPEKIVESTDDDEQPEGDEQDQNTEPNPDDVGSTTEKQSSTIPKKRGLGSGAGKVTQRKDEQATRTENLLHAIDDTIFEGPEFDGQDGPRESSVDPLQLHPNGNPKSKSKEKEKEDKKGVAQDDGNEHDDDPTLLILDEHDEDLELKLTILDIYNERYDKRLEAKAVVFDRSLVEYKKIQAIERKMPKEIRDLVIRIKPFARLQTALDHEKFQNGLIYEMKLRKRITELQEYRRMGITTLAEAERYEKEKSARLAAKLREYAAMERLGGRKQRTSGIITLQEELANASREGTPSSSGKAYKRLSPLPLSLATSASQQLLHPSELALCSRLQILPKPFIFMKQTLFQEYVRKAALGEESKRSEVSKLLSLGKLVDEDILEIDTQDEVNDDTPRDEIRQMSKKVHKLEAIWDFYFAVEGSDESSSNPDSETVKQNNGLEPTQ